MVVTFPRAASVPSQGTGPQTNGATHAPHPDLRSAGQLGGAPTAPHRPGQCRHQRHDRHHKQIPQCRWVRGFQVDGDWFDFCTGTLIAQDVVLTAAHCTDFFTGDVGDPGRLRSRRLADLDDRRDADPDEGLDVLRRGPLRHPPGLAGDVRPGGPATRRMGFLSTRATRTSRWSTSPTRSWASRPPPSPMPATWDGLRPHARDVHRRGLRHRRLHHRQRGLSPRRSPCTTVRAATRTSPLITTHDAFPDRFLKITASVESATRAGRYSRGHTCRAEHVNLQHPL